MPLPSESRLWSWHDLCQALDVPRRTSSDIVGISIDSRTIKPGDLFFALSGAARPEFNDLTDSGRDGHDFLTHAFANGAVGAVVHEDSPDDNLVIKVPETLDALWRIATFRRAQLACPVIALTGSNGKTTLKSFLKDALQAPVSEGSLNNHIGVPLSIARTPAGANYAVFEVGTNHPGEIARLSNLTQPTVAVVLNVTQAHIGNFENQDQLRLEKLSIGDGLIANEGVLLVHEPELAIARKKFPDFQVVSFGQSDESDYRFTYRNDDTVSIETPSSGGTFSVPGGGEHRAATMCAAAAVLSILKLPICHLDRIQPRLPPGRGRVFEVSGVTVIDESYNASPTSMQKCLQHLVNRNAVRHIALLGNMNELGVQSPRLHKALVPLLGAVSGAICVGSDMQQYVYAELDRSKQLGSFESLDGLLEHCLATFESGDVVLVKGSNSVFWEQRFVERLVQALAGRVQSS